jgi:hypothetical protein
VIPALDAWIARLFDPKHLDETVAELIAAQGPTEENTARLDAAQRKLADCDASLLK